MGGRRSDGWREKREEAIAIVVCGRVRFFFGSFQLHESEVRIGPLPEVRLVSYVSSPVRAAQRLSSDRGSKQML